MIGVVAGAKGECMGLLDYWNRRSAVSEIKFSFVRGFEDQFVIGLICFGQVLVQWRLEDFLGFTSW